MSVLGLDTGELKTYMTTKEVRSTYRGSVQILKELSRTREC